MSADALTIARLCIAGAAGERGFNDTRQSWLARAARRLGMRPERITSLWYGKGVRVSGDELLKLMNERCAELAWQQLRERERLDAMATQITALAGGHAADVEHPPAPGEPERDAGG